MQRGILYAIGSAVLFGMSTPLAKMLSGSTSPVMLAGLLYAAAGGRLAVVLVARQISRSAAMPLALPRRGQWGWLAGAIVLGGVAGPVALMAGLATAAASTASLLLNQR